jgi:multidrug resistance protein, MATE family
MDSPRSIRTLRWRTRPFAELVRLAWPIAISQLSFSLMTAVDTLFVGRLGAAALAGVAIGGITMFTIASFGIGTLRATKLTVALAAGAGRDQATHAYLGASLHVALGLGIATALIGQVIAQFLPALTTSAESGSAAATFTAVRTLGAPIWLIAIALREARHAIGDARTPMFATLFANVVNVGLVSLFMLHFHAGIAGVAWATTLAQAIELLCLAALQRDRGFGLREWTGHELRRLLQLGIPLGVERFFDVASMTLMVGMFARMGDRDLAAHQVTNQVMLFAFMPSIAIGEASCVLIGQAVGAVCLRAVPQVERAALAASYLYIAACSAALLGFGPQIAGVFTKDAGVVTQAASLLKLGAALLWALPLYQVGQSSLRGIGDVRVAAWIAVGAAWCCTPLFAAVLGFGFGMGVRGGWIGFALEIALAAGLFWWRLRGRSGAWLRLARRGRTTLRTQARMAA